MCVLPLELGAVFQSWLVLPCVSSGTQPEVLPKRASSILRARVKGSVWRARSWEGAPKTTSSRRRRSNEKKTFKKMMAEFPEIKLVKLLIIALREKNTLMKRNCVGQTFIVYCSKAATLQQKSNLFKWFSTGVRKKRSWWISLLFLNFIFHQLQITYNSITNFYPALSTSFRLPSWWCHAFLQERIQKSSPRAGGKACAILKGRAQKRCVSIHSRKKWR